MNSHYEHENGLGQIEVESEHMFGGYIGAPDSGG